MDSDVDYDALAAEAAESASANKDERNLGASREPWLKFTQKGQVVRAAVVHFKAVDETAAIPLIKAGKSRDEVRAAALAALTERATKLSKTVEQLSDIERLDTNKAQFKVLKAHYMDGVGFTMSRLGKDGPEADKVWKQLPDARNYFTTLLLIYPLDRDGQLDKDAFVSQLKNRKPLILPYRFSASVYDTLWRLADGLRANDLDLASQDIVLECEEPKYQKLSARTAGKAVWRTNENTQQIVLEQAVPKYKSLKCFRELTTDELRAKLSGDAQAKPEAGALATSDFSSILENLN